MTSESLSKVVKLQLTLDQLPKEPVRSDGTMLHGLERVIGLLPELLSKRTLLVRMPDTMR